MRKNLVRAACYSGEVSIGTFVSIADPVSAQIFAHSNFAWLVIDMEHGPVPMAALSGIINAIRATATEPFVRAQWNTSAAIQVALDHGASGVMVPMVNSAADAQRAVDDVRFSPLGARSRGGVKVALSFDTDSATYFRTANDEVPCRLPPRGTARSPAFLPHRRLWRTNVSSAATRSSVAEPTPRCCGRRPAGCARKSTHDNP